MPRKIIRRRPAVAEVESVEPMHVVAKKPSSHRWLIPVVVVLVLAAAGVTAWTYLPTVPRTASNASASTGSVADLVKQVSKHVLVSASENPMVATVQDPDSLRTQNPVFYKDAQQGDKLLVWSDKAVLFSPARNVVVAMLAMSAFKADAAAPTQQAVATQPQSASKDEVVIEVRNGSATAGLARKAADSLKADGWKIVTIADAKVKPVAKTEVFVSSKKSLGSLPATLATSLGGSVVKSLGNEPASSADILVIIGNDAQ